MAARRVNRVSRPEPKLDRARAGLSKGGVGSREPEGWETSRFRRCNSHGKQEEDHGLQCRPVSVEDFEMEPSGHSKPKFFVLELHFTTDSVLTTV